jgi:hypothetical protein
MYAVEFQTTAKDGVIENPLEYRAQVPGRVRVIVLADESPAIKLNMIEYLLAHPIEARGFKPLTREETHASGNLVDSGFDALVNYGTLSIDEQP